MPSPSGSTSRSGSAFLLGLAATLAVAAGHLGGLGERAELIALDLCFQHAPFAPPNEQVLHVDIDDDSLTELGEWPWPREVLAGIIDTLHTCGAKRVALDIILPDPQKLRYVSATGDVYSGDTSAVFGAASPRPVLDDAILAEVMRRAGNVFVPMYLDFDAPAADGPLACKVRGFLARRPTASLDDVLKAVLPQRDKDVYDDAFEQVRRAYLNCRAEAALIRRVPPMELANGGFARQGRVVPPLVTFAASCGRTGFVTRKTDVDGAVRQMPLLGRSGRQVYPQFALTIAAELLAQGHGGLERITAEKDRLRLRFADGAEQQVPVDSDGCMLINWVKRSGPRATRRIPASAVLAVWQARKRLENNHNLARLMALELAVSFGQAELLDSYARVAKAYRRRMELEIQRYRAKLFSPANVPSLPAALLKEEKKAEADISRQTAVMMKDFDFYVQGMDKADPTRRKVERIRRRLEQIPAENRQINQQIQRIQRRLRGIVAGKVCLVGSNATGAADFVPTPVGKTTPGVDVHANVINTIVSGAFVRRAGVAANLLAIILAGALLSAVAARRPIMLQALPLMIVLSGGYVIANALVAFKLLHTSLAMVSPLTAMLASFVVVSAYRQLTEERAKRRIRGMFAHALSPALVDRLIDDPTLANLGGQKRVLSCFFSDLAGFTPLAERLGEQRTVQLLNRYFDRVTELLQDRHGGYLNKFLGDGVFAFFGAPVPQEDHARRALTAALDYLREVHSLNESLDRQQLGDTRLSVRIGIATGEVMVGNCGSTHRMDYTAIGDPVNLASRLESANKYFGTGILIDGASWASAGNDEFLVRSLGRLRVVGKVEPTDVYHLADYRAEAPAEVQRAFEQFARAVTHFQRRDFAAAGEIFQKLTEADPADRAAQVYLQLCRTYQASPPAKDWTATIELTEK